jgi:hypothetical protein
MAYGVRGVLIDAERTHPAGLARWIIGAAFVHDLLFVPLVAIVAWVAHRLIGARWWPALRWGLVTSAVVVAYALPSALGYGEDPTNPSLLPRNYALGAAAFVAGVWIVTLARLLLGATRARRSVSRSTGR